MTNDATRQQLLVDLARLLLTPGASVDEWVADRIRWHRLDGNDALADELLADENKQRRALDMMEIEA